MRCLETQPPFNSSNDVNQQCVSSSYSADAESFVYCRTWLNFLIINKCGHDSVSIESHPSTLTTIANSCTVGPFSKDMNCYAQKLELVVSKERYNTGNKYPYQCCCGFSCPVRLSYYSYHHRHWHHGSNRERILTCLFHSERTSAIPSSIWRLKRAINPVASPTQPSIWGSAWQEDGKNNPSFDLQKNTFM